MSGVQSNAPAMACLATLTLIVYNNSIYIHYYILISIISPKDELDEPKEGKYMSRSFEIKMLFRSLLSIHEAYRYIYIYICIYLKRKSAFATCTGLTCRALFNQSRRKKVPPAQPVAGHTDETMDVTVGTLEKASARKTCVLS